MISCHGGHVHGGREDVVRGLAEIDLVVRMHAPRFAAPAAEEFQPAHSTSFMFMLVCVPEPVCQTLSGIPVRMPSALTSSAATMIAIGHVRIEQVEIAIDHSTGPLAGSKGR